MSTPRKTTRGTYGEGVKPRLNKRGRWEAAIDDGWTAQGKRHRRWVYGRTEQECKRKLREAKRDVLTSEAAAVNPSQTVKGWCDEWIEDYRTHARPDTVSTDEPMMRKWIIPTLGRRRLRDLGAADMRKLERVMHASDDVGDTTVHYVCALLRRILKAARIDGYVVPDPIMLRPLPSPAASDREALAIADATTLLAAATSRDTWPQAPELPKLPYGAVTAMDAVERQARRQIISDRKDWTLARATDPSRWVAALLQGLRSSEARGLTWDRVDFDAHTLTVDRQLKPLVRGTTLPRSYTVDRLDDSYVLATPKTSSGERIIPMVPWMEKALQRWQGEQGTSPHGLVWPRASGAPMSKADDLRAWHGLQRIAGVHKEDGSLYVLHEARHTTVSLLLAANVPPSVVIAIVGHSSFASTKHYSHTDMAAAMDALTKVADRLQLAV